jgi:C4-dicarboxylate-specific signal transduction histidine kinase
MASGVAHEINNPLAIISGTASILKREVSKESPATDFIMKRLDTIEKTTFRIADIIKGLRTFARNSESDPFEQHEIHKIIQETLQFCLERFKKHDVHVRYDIENNALISCRAPQISQILLNLLNNAFDAIKDLPEKWVEIHVHERNEAIEIEVIDSGKGISQAIVDKMMQPFFTTKPVGEGTGLGLSISKGIAEEHSGALSYKPAPNTTFVLRLPKAS